MKKIFLLTVFTTGLLLANGVIASPDFLLKNGLTTEENHEASVSGNNHIETLKQEVKIIKKKKVKTTSFKDALIMEQFLKNKNNSATKTGRGNFISLPASYAKDKKEYTQLLQAQKDAQKLAQSQSKKDVSEMLFLKCSTFMDYKIYASTNLKMICYDEDNSAYKLFASLTISKNSIEMISKPYLIEFENGKKAFLDDKSKLFNATNGSENLATYVDRRVYEQINKSMATTIGSEVPSLTKDYIDQKNKADSTVVTDNTGTTSTTTTAVQNPKPKVEDYGIKLLVDTLSSGLKAGMDQLYQDLGYIYFIPKGSVFDAQIVVKSSILPQMKNE